MSWFANNPSIERHSRSGECKMTSPRTSASRVTISILTAFSILLAACEVDFEPDVEPLVIEGPPDQSVGGEIAPGNPEIEEHSLGGGTGAELGPEFGSSDALTLGGEGLSWGDEAMGMCLAPGGDTYFAWTNEENVIRIAADATDINQAIFQEAARERASAIGEIKSQSRSVISEAGGFLVALLAAVPACATIIGCALDGAGLLVMGGLLADSGSSIVDSIGLGEMATKRADYSYCRLLGGSDAECRISAGITDELEGD